MVIVAITADRPAISASANYFTLRNALSNFKMRPTWRVFVSNSALKSQRMPRSG